MDRSTTVTELLHRASEGDRGALDELIPLVYEELRRSAHDQRTRWQGDQTLGTTALVNEAYLRLVVQERPQWDSRAHFLAVASKAMRHILIDYSRSRRARKRGGDLDHVTLDAIDDVLPALRDLSIDQAETLIELDRCLERLELESERHCRIVECRLFGGMTVKETATALGVSRSTVKRGWTMARTWLYRELKAS